MGGTQAGIGQSESDESEQSGEQHERQSGGQSEVLTDVIDQLVDNVDGDDTSVDDVLSAFDDRSFGALCAIIGIIAASPIVGAIPGMSIVTGVLVLLIAGQQLVGRTHPWIPKALRKRSISSDKLKAGAKKVRPYAAWVDQFIKPRYGWAVAGRVQRRIIAILLCAAAITMVPLALVPWGVFPPALAILVFGVAVMARDGAFAIAGYLFVALTAYTMYALWTPMVAALSWLFGG